MTATSPDGPSGGCAHTLCASQTMGLCLCLCAGLDRLYPGCPVHDPDGKHQGPVAGGERMPTICLSCNNAIPASDYVEHRRHCQHDIAAANAKFGATTRARAWIGEVSVVARGPGGTLGEGSADLLDAGRDRVIELLGEIETLEDHLEDLVEAGADDPAGARAGHGHADEVVRALFEVLTTARRDQALIDRNRRRGRVEFPCRAVNDCPMAGWCSGPGHDICPLELYAANRFSHGGPG